MSPLSADDRLAILDLLGRWNLYEDSGQAQAWAGLFTTDGMSISLTGKVLAGHEALAANASKRWAMKEARLSAHWMNAPIITGTADRAHVEHYGVMVSRPADREPELRMETHAVRRYEFIKTDGEWRILHRTISAFPEPDRSAGATTTR